ncbi:MAG: hypothetical protein QWI36_04055 [Wolbachia endosymbiont of Tyrophagus putrescentiae]|nr:hypothetical protein [Wolbachia endosymbiont of Tyrophagus putrescentiae]
MNNIDFTDKSLTERIQVLADQFQQKSEEETWALRVSPQEVGDKFSIYINGNEHELLKTKDYKINHHHAEYNTSCRDGQCSSTTKIKYDVTCNSGPNDKIKIEEEYNYNSGSSYLPLQLKFYDGDGNAIGQYSIKLSSPYLQKENCEPEYTVYDIFAI